MSDESKPRRSSPVDAADILAIAGAGSVTYGVWLTDPPVAFIVAGIFILLASAIRAAAKARK